MVQGTAGIFTVLASSVLILGGVAALVRAIWRAAQAFKDNARATVQNTSALNNLSNTVDGRMSHAESTLTEHDRRIAANEVRITDHESRITGLEKKP